MNLIHTTSRYCTPDDDFSARAFCECGWISAPSYSRDEGRAIMAAENAAASHVSSVCRLDESGLYREV